VRKIGTIEDETRARLFSDYLYAAGLGNEIEPSRSGGWNVWIHAEDAVAKGEEELARFLANPSDPCYSEAQRTAADRRRSEKRDAARSRARIIDVRTTWAGAALGAFGPLTGALIAVSVVLWAAQYIPQGVALRDWLSITAWKVSFRGFYWDPSLPELRRGQLWRLVTPIFLHSGLLHLFFNMLWLRALGGAIELREGRGRLLAQVLVFAAVSNFAQYEWAGPAFGGMSGVVYGLFGYMWVCVRYDPARRYALDQVTVVTMIAWFFICMAGLVAHVANAAHAGGLAAGIIWGAISVRRIPFTPIRW
jgi:GlpG protein